MNYTGTRGNTGQARAEAVHWPLLEIDRKFSWAQQLPLEEATLAGRFVGLDGAQHGSDGLIKYCLEALLGESRALQVFGGTDLLGHGQTLQEETYSLP